MNPDQSTLYNKFHILSIGLRKLETLINHSETEKIKELLVRLTRESDDGMEKIKEMDLGWREG